MLKFHFSAGFLSFILAIALSSFSTNSHATGWLQGDVNIDGVVNHGDAVLTGDILVGRVASPTSETLKRANANLDGKLSVADLVWIQNQCIKPQVLVFKIDNGATSTPIRTVMLNNGSYFNPTFYIASESPDFAGAQWQMYSIAPRFTLSPGNGAKKVYFKVKNANFESKVVSATIELNEIEMRQFVRLFDNCYSVNDSAQQTMDGGYLFSGLLPDNGRSAVTLNKTDAGGNQLWQKTYHDTYYAHIYSMDLTGDEGAILAGDELLLKTDAQGNELWRRFFDSIIFFHVKQTGDGGYVILGIDLINECDLMIKTDIYGNVLWEKNCQDNGYFSVVQQTPDGGYIIGGEIKKTGSDGYDARLLKMDALGNTIWEKTFGGVNDDYVSDLQQTNDGGFILAGDKQTEGWYRGNSSWLIKTDESGNKIWEQPIEVADYNSVVNVQQTTDGGYLLAGSKLQSPGTLKSNWLVRTDLSGKKLWEQDYCAANFLFSGFGRLAADGGYVLTGDFINDYQWMNHQYAYLIKTDRSGQVSPHLQLTQFAINNGAVSSTSRTVTLNNTCTGYPISYMASESTTFSYAWWQAYDSAPKFTLSLGNGQKHVYFKVMSVTGETAMTSASVTVNLPKPAITAFSIDNGALITTRSSVTINIACTGEPDSYMLSESPNFTPNSWMAYKSSSVYALPGGNGLITIYAKVKNQTAESSVTSATIKETGFPVITAFSINNGATTTTNHQVILKNSCSANPLYFRASESSYFDGAVWQKYLPETSFTLSQGNGTKTIWFEVKNSDWYSKPTSSTITIMNFRKFINTFPDYEYGTFNSVQQTLDNGYILAGSTSYMYDLLFFGVHNEWIVKTDANGIKLWDRIIPYNWGIPVIKQTKDGGYIVVDGKSFHYGDPIDCRAIKLDINGNTVWEKVFEGLGKYGEEMQVTQDNGYIISGTTLKGSNEYNTLIIKLDHSGNEVWRREIDTWNKNYPVALEKTPDNGFIILGRMIGSSYYRIPWIIKIDEFGNKLLEKTLNSNVDYKFDSIQQSEDGGYIIAGSTSFDLNMSKIVILKIDYSGNQVWNKIYGTYDSKSKANHIIQTNDRGFIVTGLIRCAYTEWNNCGWVIRIDASGNELWEKYFGLFGKNPANIWFTELFDVCQTIEGGYILAGSNEKGWIIKTDSQGNSE